MLKLPLVVLLEEHGADQADDAFLVGEDPDDVGASLHFLVEPFERIRAVQLHAVLLGEGHVGEHVVFGIVHAGTELRPAVS